MDLKHAISFDTIDTKHLGGCMRFLSAVLIYSKDADRLSAFYKDVVGIPLEEENHGQNRHYGCELGDIHFAIHQAEAGEKPGVGSINIAFEVFDIERHMRLMAQKNVKIVSQPKDLGFMKLAVIEDPDGNTIEFTELSSEWIEHLRERRAQGRDIVSAWDRRNNK
jgi:predicted enzyme related to lactoylglutathione lyase